MTRTLRMRLGGPKITKRIVTAFLFTIVIVLMMLWLSGALHPKVGPSEPVVSAAHAVGNKATAEVVVRQMPRIESAVGTIRAVHETSVASELLAKVIDVQIRAGQTVVRGEVLVRLDKEEPQARLDQAQAVIRAANARQEQAQLVFERVQQAFDSGAATQTELDRERTNLDAAVAETERAVQASEEAQTVLSHATIVSPIDGTVVDKYVEAGDTVQPGQVVAKVFDPTRMQLVARVRESLAKRLAVNDVVEVVIESINLTCSGTISEIVPEAESASRAFTVKVTGPCPPNVYTGMFGRLMIPLDDEPVLLIPQRAIRNIGQLNIVDVVDGDVLRRRSVEIGRKFGNDVEVLSGLRAGERVALDDQDRSAPGEG